MKPRRDDGDDQRDRDRRGQDLDRAAMKPRRDDGDDLSLPSLVFVLDWGRNEAPP